MLLFAFLTLLIFIISFASRIVLFVINLFPSDKSIESITSNIVQLKKDLSVISMVDDFAKYARLQRKIIKLQEEKKNLIASNVSKLNRVKNKFLIVIYAITSITLLILVWMYREEAVTKLPSEWLWPVPNIFNWYKGSPGCISIISWVAMSYVAARTLAENI